MEKRALAASGDEWAQRNQESRLTKGRLRLLFGLFSVCVCQLASGHRVPDSMQLAPQLPVSQ